MSEKLLDIVPESPRHPYDMYDVIREIVDDGEIFDIKPKFAKTIITCLARFGGQPVGIVANQPKQLGGILENDSADKAARFINLCDAFNIPLVFLQDVPGFMVGSKVEHAGIIRHGAKMLYAVSRATVPKVTVVVRKAYGAGYYVMNGKAYEPDLIVAWPSAEISVMGAEGAVNIIGRSAIEASDDPGGDAGEDARGRPQADRPLHRGGQRDDRRHHRPARDAADDHPRPADGRRQAGRAALEEARGDAGMNEAPLDVARRGYARWAAGDFDGMLELATPDFEFVPAIAASVEGGSIKGRDAARRFCADLDETWETFRISADDFREAGGRVLGIGRLTAKGRGSELELDQPIYTVLWFQGDRIARMQSFLEESAARAATRTSLSTRSISPSRRAC